MAASSPFFKTLLAKHKHPHPLIYMRGVNSDNLVAIIEFLYRGEANILQENLDSFILIAEDLKLQGLVGSTEDARKGQREESKSRLFSKNPINQASSNLPFVREEDSIFKHGGAMSLLNNSDQYLNELDEKVKSMIEKSDRRMPVGKIFHRVCICKVCGKEGQWVAIRDHIEINHLEGVSLACNQCEKSLKSRHNLRMHKKLNHKALKAEYFSI